MRVSETREHNRNNIEPNLEFLKIIKRIRWQPVPDEYKKLAIDMLKKYKNYMDSYFYDYEKDTETLKNKLIDVMKTIN